MPFAGTAFVVPLKVVCWLLTIIVISLLFGVLLLAAEPVYA